jgi:hypothetical protein
MFSARAAEIVHLPPEQFVTRAFAGQPPKSEVLWLSRDISAQAAQILGHSPSQLRQRYWRDDAKSVWILDEIGKEEPITAGFVIENGRIAQAQVLIYRESRGGEIRHAPFLKQYEGATLTTDHRLDRGIDGISGATLSVRAMERMARLALYFDAVKQ